MLTQYRLLDPWSKLTYDRLLDSSGGCFQWAHGEGKPSTASALPDRRATRGETP